jgi:glycerol kinase
MSFILALDQGTSSSRAIIFDHDGAMRAAAQKEFRQIFPQAGWVEHDPREIWSSQLEVAHVAMKKAGLKVGHIDAIGITNQRETTVVWDRRTGEPIHNAIVWQDRRTAGFCDGLKRAGHADLIGLVITLFFREQNPLASTTWKARASGQPRRTGFGTIDTWLL